MVTRRNADGPAFGVELRHPRGELTTEPPRGRAHRQAAKSAKVAKREFGGSAASAVAWNADVLSSAITNSHFFHVARRGLKRGFGSLRREPWHSTPRDSFTITPNPICRAEMRLRRVEPGRPRSQRPWRSWRLGGELREPSRDAPTPHSAATPPALETLKLNWRFGPARLTRISPDVDLLERAREPFKPAPAARLRSVRRGSRDNHKPHICRNRRASDS